MKIISKHKDYFDYYSGIYGIDEKLILDRRNWDLKQKSVLNIDYIKHDLLHCIAFNNKFYFQIQLCNNNKIVSTSEYLKNKTSKDWSINYGIKAFKKMLPELSDIEHKLNKDLRVPYVLTTYNLDFRWLNYNKLITSILDKSRYSNIILKDFEFHKIKSSEQAFNEISMFLGWMIDNPEKPDNRTNNIKIQNAGFDLKNSFRKSKN